MSSTTIDHLAILSTTGYTTIIIAIIVPTILACDTLYSPTFTGFLGIINHTAVKLPKRAVPSRRASACLHLPQKV